MTLGLAACHSDDSGFVVPPPAAYSVAGTITGLSAAGLVLQNNGADSLAVTANSSSFRFETQVAAGGAYNVTVSTQPAGLTCTVSHGSGSDVAAPVANVSIACNPVSYTIAGSITGLTADGLVLQNNGADNLSVSANAATFQFSAPVAAASGYSVTAIAQPTGLTCTVSHGTGTNVRADVSNVSVTCSASAFTIGGTVTGLTAAGLVLQDNGGDNLAIPAGSSSFVFATPVAYGSSYAATVFAQPAGQICIASNAAGTAKANVIAVTVSCSTIVMYTVTPAGGPNGSIAPSVPQSVNAGSSQSFVATPSASYAINQWLLDGVAAQTGGTTFTLSDVTANHTVNVTFAQAVLTPSISSLALAVNNPALNAALTGAPRVITITNTGTLSAANLAVASSGFPTGTAITSSTCSATLAAAASCAITITPGSSSTSNCAAGTAPTGGSITVSSDDASPSTVGVVVLGYGCIYQEGYLYAVDDTTPNTQSIGGKVAAVTDQSSGTYWSSDGAGNASFNAVYGISETSTTSSPDPSSGQVAGQTACNGNIDGLCDSNNIYVYYQTDAPNAPINESLYAAGLCEQTISGYSDWYLPSICEMGYGSCGPMLQNMQFNLVDNGNIGSLAGGVYWSSTESSSDPTNWAWLQVFATGGSSFQGYTSKASTAAGVRCSRALSL